VHGLISVLKGEMEISMRLLGVNSVDQLGPEYLNCERL
jgi:isopentenyl diphosphate isomerase/L-lactate dehydrogenase-like FMN-dependent dehydrogenase